MLFLVLKKVRMVKSLLVRFPPLDKKIPPAKLPISLTVRGFPPTSKRYCENSVLVLLLLLLFIIDLY